MSTDPPKPPRVRVTAPQTRLESAAGAYPVSREMAEQSDVGELFIRSLIRSQLRLAVVVASGFLFILIGIPVVIATFPVISDLTVFTVPLPWVLLGLGIYPLVISCAALYVRSASRNEKRFRDLVDDS